MELRFTGGVLLWRGPAPFHFVRVPEAESALIADLAPAVSYGWGMIPVSVRIGATATTTSLWPKDGAYLVPLKAALRRAEGLDVGEEVEVALVVG